MLCNTLSRGWPEEWRKHVGGILCLSCNVRYSCTFICICWFRYHSYDIPCINCRHIQFESSCRRWLQCSANYNGEFLFLKGVIQDWEELSSLLSKSSSALSQCTARFNFQVCRRIHKTLPRRAMYVQYHFGLCAQPLL